MQTSFSSIIIVFIKLVLILSLAFGTIGCEVDEENCKEQVSETYTWINGTWDNVTHIGGSGYDTQLLFYRNKAEFYDICPTGEVNISAIVRGTDGHFSPAPNYIWLRWYSDLGFMTYKDHIPMYQTSDNIWQGSVTLDNISYSFSTDTPGNLEVWVEIGLARQGSLEQDIEWLQDEFREVSFTTVYTKF